MGRAFEVTIGQIPWLRHPKVPPSGSSEIPAADCAGPYGWRVCACSYLERPVGFDDGRLVETDLTNECGELGWGAFSSSGDREHDDVESVAA